jgi:hypothetical protein
MNNDLDAVVAWLRSYVAADHETEFAQYVEHDQQKYVALIRNLERFFSDEVSTGLDASLPALNDDDRALFRAQADTLIPRAIFKIKRWKHPQEGVLYQAYMGSPIPARQNGYHQSLLVKPMEGQFTIVARYTACLACFATGLYDGKRCPDCSAPGWDYREGLNLKSFGNAQATRHLQVPTNPAFLPEYESDLDLDSDERS